MDNRRPPIGRSLSLCSLSHDDRTGSLDDVPVAQEVPALPVGTGQSRCGGPHGLTRVQIVDASLRGVGTTSDATTSDADRSNLLHDLRRLLDRDWLPDVLVALSAGPRLYTNLLQTIRAYGTPRTRPGPRQYFHDKVFNQTLRWMEERGLVERTKEEMFPFHASYRLTPAAEELIALSAPMVEWAERHEDLLALDRRARDERRRGKNGHRRRRPTGSG